MQRIARFLTPAVMATLTRLGFAAVLLPWFLIGGLTKIAGSTLSVGPPAGIWPLSLGAYHTFLPEVMMRGAVPTAGQHAFVLAMTLSELVLPLLVVIGAFGRVFAVLLIAHIWIAGLATGHLPGGGNVFDASPFDPGPDRVVLWSIVLLHVVAYGVGPLSLDRLIDRLRRGRIPPARRGRDG
ncbi:hypothetical protein [Jannaschia formosa]|uniref:hypothetical protein n=1 Tax=Jannaschia formosa TaxID=2259592 RepID=UPI000E1BB5B9|nr:hypothetical protein [Jannaschia formosa]TFL17507.1 hypothetical protein DR046_13820 [Jannaschia formosa]